VIFPIPGEENDGAARAVETAAAVEIDKGSLRRFFRDDFHQPLGKASAKNASAFPQLPQRRERLITHPKNLGKQTQHFFYSLSKGGRRNRMQRMPMLQENSTRSKTPSMQGNILEGYWEIPSSSAKADRIGKSKDTRR